MIVFSQLTLIAPLMAKQQDNFIITLFASWMCVPCALFTVSLSLSQSYLCYFGFICKVALKYLMQTSVLIQATPTFLPFSFTKHSIFKCRKGEPKIEQEKPVEKWRNSSQIFRILKGNNTIEKGVLGRRRRGSPCNVY